MAQKILVSWTTMVLGYSRFCLMNVALVLLFKIPEKKSAYGFTFTLKEQYFFRCCTEIAQVDMYAERGNIAKAVKVFGETPQTKCLAWTAIICGLALHGNPVMLYPVSRK
ncbi:hypothetical protein Lal_00011205 [Lupinus albus]|nr:hypothetical protein Lal_00011205 [Lupinus albus]